MKFRRRILVPRLPTLIEADYAHRIVGLVRRWQHAARHVVQALSQILGARQDAGDVELANRLMAKVLSEVDHVTNDTALAGLARDFGQRVANHHKVDLVRQARAALGIEVFIRDQRLAGALQQFVYENVTLIRKLQTSTLGALEALIYRGIGTGMTVADLGDQIAHRFDIGERHARFIARDQVSRVYSNMCELRHAELGVTRFQWWTMEDGHVRKLHRLLHAKEFAYSDPPAIGLPGNTRDGPCCRCFQRPVWESVEASVSVQADMPADALEQAQRIGAGMRVPAEPQYTPPAPLPRTPRAPIAPPVIRR